MRGGGECGIGLKVRALGGIRFTLRVRARTMSSSHQDGEENRSIQRNPPIGVTSKEKLTCAETRSEPKTFSLLGGEGQKRARARAHKHLF